MSKFIEMLTINNLGSWASIIGLSLTFITFMLLFGIKKKFLFHSSVDDHIKKIAEISSEVSSLLQTFTENQKDIEELFAVANVELRAMQRGATGDLLTDIKKSRNKIKRYESLLYFWVEKNEVSAREIKTTLSVVSAELKHQRKSLITGN